MPKTPSLLLLLSGLLLWNGQISSGIGFISLSYAQNPPETAPNVDALKDDPFKEIPPQPAQPEPAAPKTTITTPPPATLPVAKKPVTPAATPVAPLAVAATPTPIPAAPVATPQPIFAEPAAAATPASMAPVTATPAPLPETIAPLATPALMEAAAAPSPSATPDLAAALASPAPEAVATPTPSIETAPVATLEEPKFGEEGYVSHFEKAKPSWAYGVRVAFNAFPLKTSSVGDSFQIYSEYILPYQEIGDFSFGLHFGSFPLNVPESGIPYPVYENYDIGGTFRYAGRFSRHQIFIPTAALELDYYALKKGMGSDKISGTNVGVLGGLMLALDPLDPRVARDSYEELGMVHAYLTIEVRSLNISNDLFDLKGSLWYFGIRLEYE